MPGKLRHLIHLDLDPLDMHQLGECKSRLARLEELQRAGGGGRTPDSIAAERQGLLTEARDRTRTPALPPLYCPRK